MNSSSPFLRQFHRSNWDFLHPALLTSHLLLSALKLSLLPWKSKSLVLYSARRFLLILHQIWTQIWDIVSVETIIISIVTQSHQPYILSLRTLDLSSSRPLFSLALYLFVIHSISNFFQFNPTLYLFLCIPVGYRTSTFFPSILFLKPMEVSASLQLRLRVLSATVRVKYIIAPFPLILPVILLHWIV